jgi:hypothetical protein
MGDFDGVVEVGDILRVKALSVDHEELHPGAIEIDPKGFFLIGQGGESECDGDYSLIQTPLHET